ncbi:hypothetical protein [Plasmodium yoelii yoelii]|uniref:Uncharacterized protein n=2 Tax=Plasmodium yoelii yoelii TaxID=73239 RepID=Q7RFE4_PLAYO|nr:hypothetical protein [Plasmodium yoelii yoelii]
MNYESIAFDHLAINVYFIRDKGTRTLTTIIEETAPVKLSYKYCRNLPDKEFRYLWTYLFSLSYEINLPSSLKKIISTS